MPDTSIHHRKSDALGKQLVIEMYDCDAERFDDVHWIKNVLVEAARRARATIVETVFHRFNPHGISGVVVISESHFAIHTWPEYRYAALDIFTCGDTLEGDTAISHIAREFECSRYTVTTLQRGLIVPRPAAPETVLTRPASLLAAGHETMLRKIVP
ncbi:MAG: adenosylmethionine decarboxylase [Gammaproteobacteria bacterium]|nr:adenosylmethionine decarboxylase [Gammaproteobacteria bacterium]